MRRGKTPARTNKGNLSHVRNCPTPSKRYCGGPRLWERRSECIAAGLSSRRTPENLISTRVQVCLFSLPFEFEGGFLSQKTILLSFIYLYLYRNSRDETSGGDSGGHLHHEWVYIFLRHMCETMLMMTMEEAVTVTIVRSQVRGRRGKRGSRSRRSRWRSWRRCWSRLTTPTSTPGSSWPRNCTSPRDGYR